MKNKNEVNVKMKVNLSDVIEGIEFENDMLNHYYNKKTGVIIYKEDSETSSYSAHDIHKIDQMEEWEKELVSGLYDLNENPQDYIKLPGRDETDEIKMMVEFCNSFSDIKLENTIDSDNDYNKMLHDIKNIIRDKGLINEWYDYREASEKEIAIEWCNKNNIEYIEQIELYKADISAFQHALISAFIFRLINKLKKNRGKSSIWYIF